MSKPVLIYCYDAYCGWCYAFSPVINRIANEFSERTQIEVLSGGMILPEKPMPVSMIADFVSKAYKQVEETSGIKFGQDFLWHIFNPDQSDWFLNSEKPAIALCILKQLQPERMIEFAADLQYALNYEGRDLTDDEAYRHLLEKYQLTPESFYHHLHAEEYKQLAHREFALVKQLQINGFPALLMQKENGKIYWVANGFTDYETVKNRIEKLISEN